jgi:hypothetical protein
MTDQTRSEQENTRLSRGEAREEANAEQSSMKGREGGGAPQDHSTAERRELSSLTDRERTERWPLG